MMYRSKKTNLNKAFEWLVIIGSVYPVQFPVLRFGPVENAFHCRLQGLVIVVDFQHRQNTLQNGISAFINNQKFTNKVGEVLLVRVKG